MNMIEFLNKEVKWNKFELLIDTKIFPKEIIFKASYNFLDKWYFFFKLDNNKNIILQFTPKDGIKEKSEFIIWNFSDELLSVLLRDKLEKDNKDIREKIVWAAIANSLDSDNFVEFNTDKDNWNQLDEIDFDKDIDEILKEIENDPDLKIDEEEIERILKEIEDESKNDSNSIVLDPENVKKAKGSIKKANKENKNKTSKTTLKSKKV